MRTGNRNAHARVPGCHLCRGGQQHQKTYRESHDEEQHSQAERPGKGAIRQALEEQQDFHGHIHQREDGDADPHNHVDPRITWTLISAISMTVMVAMLLVRTRSRRLCPWMNVNSQRKVNSYTENEMANCAGFTQPGTPVIIR